MKDLYKRLNITPTAFVPEIREALSGIRDEDLRKRTEGILLQPKRRQVYDKNHDLLSKISELRANLGVNHGEFWGSGDFSDFTTEPTQTDTEIAKLNRTVETAVKNVKSKKRWSGEGCFVSAVNVCVTIMLLGALGGVISLFDFTSSDETSDSYAAQGISRSEFTEPAIPAPNHGHVFFEKESYGDKAPFEIKTPWGSGDHIIKLKNWSTGELVLSAFVLEGASFETEVPLGTYRLQYASGDSWYGIEHLFGPDTVYGQAESQLKFFNNGINLMGHVVELIPQCGGNLRTGRISAGDF